MNRIKPLLLSAVFTLAALSPAFAAQPPTSQEMSGQVRTRELQEEEKALRKQIETKKKKPVVEEKLPQEAPPAAPTEKTLITKINVIGATLIPEKAIRGLVAPFENKELDLKEMQGVADVVTEAYRKKGYVTSRAYLPPQKIELGVLEIRIMEGRMGDLDTRGNYHYKTFLFKKKFSNLKKGLPFNYNILTKILRKINEQPDRVSRAVLTPGKEPGATDVLLEVKDNLPVHVGFDFDNYASRYLYRDRYQINVIDNNLFGFEDIAIIRYSLCEANSYEALSASYLLPATDTLKLGAFGSAGRLHLIKDVKDLDIYGKSRLLSFYANQSIVDEENASFAVNIGFDYKNIYNYQFQNMTSSDRMRVVKTGFDLDITDIVGRTILTNEIDIGLDGFMGGLQAKDSRASRIGAGGEFVKYVINLLRLQTMPLSSTLLWSNQLQVSNKVLTATEQYQLGGATNVRGYPPGELVGDNGFSTSLEWDCPPYFIPKGLKIPFTNVTFYDAIRFAVFYDYGNVRLRKPLPTEKKNDQLSDVGWGFRVTVSKNVFVKADFAWALDRKPSDGDIQHSWVQVSTRF